MKNKRTNFLRGSIAVLGFIILAACVFWLPGRASYFATIGPEFAHLQYPVLIGIYITTIPFYYALFQTLRLLNYIDSNKPFSEKSEESIKKIKYAAFVISALYFIGFIFINFQKGALAPGVGLLGLLIAFASIAIAIFAAVLEELLNEAIMIKEENDYTI